MDDTEDTYDAQHEAIAPYIGVDALRTWAAALRGSPDPERELVPILATLARQILADEAALHEHALRRERERAAARIASLERQVIDLTEEVQVWRRPALHDLAIALLDTLGCAPQMEI